MCLHLQLAFVKLDEMEVQLHIAQVELSATKETTRKLEEKFEETTRNSEEKLEETSRKLEKKFEETSRKLQEKLDETARRLEEKFEESTRKLMKEFIALENRLTHCQEEPTWKISGFSELLRQAQSGEKTTIDSAPFYTGIYGYKFQMRLYPNGSGTGKNTHLSVFFILMEGDCDPILPWPFYKKVTLMLIDQREDLDDRQNIVNSLTPAANHKEWNSRPMGGPNTSRGFVKFVSHTKLRERRFIEDDTTDLFKLKSVRQNDCNFKVKELPTRLLYEIARFMNDCLVC